MAYHREMLCRQPRLRQLFLELTLRCNEYCIHCGRRCGDVCGEELSGEQLKLFLKKVAADFDVNDMMLCITGGEPLLREDFFDIMGFAKSLGFRWGMTSNATLIDAEVASGLYRTGMGTISVSIDGLRETHDRLRGLTGAYDRAMSGIEALIKQGGFKHIQVTTTVNHENISELPELFEILKELDIDSWRIGTIEPIGRALVHKELMLTDEDYRTIFAYIRQKRREGYPVEYGCTHYLGFEYEREVRNWYYICSAGRTVASVMANGDIGACLDIERCKETIQGNIRKDDFTHVWRDGFQVFRQDLSLLDRQCDGCESARYCAGGSFHSFDLEKRHQRVCLKSILF